MSDPSADHISENSWWERKHKPKAALYPNVRLGTQFGGQVVQDLHVNKGKTPVHAKYPATYFPVNDGKFSFHYVESSLPETRYLPDQKRETISDRGIFNSRLGTYTPPCKGAMK